jgi:NitT/TauT family transport system substrate-binding protein
VAALREVFPGIERTDDALMQAAVYSFTSVCPGGAGDHIGATDDETWADIFGVMTTGMGFTDARPVTDYYTLDYLPEEPVTCP